MFLRHYAWLTALRFQLREPRIWENTGTAQFDEYAKNMIFRKGFQSWMMN